MHVQLVKKKKKKKTVFYNTTQIAEVLCAIHILFDKVASG
jgi:hypothetical protein